ncbi:ORF3 protein [Armillaria mellea negative strand RNA virus 2]|uniref:ORF3 protein n=1 Tax=Armillaria mellea negative strand RNA virus 2 TaxID=2803971 RepID=A0A8D9PCQ7_9MONO|nr:ORF3 protein [Armillaria mellea negative strand RNA virus 2]DAD54829.1 TPA_asm: ORF3 protein [Armillaria mellea negative strand RNA virus 2]
MSGDRQDSSYKGKYLTAKLLIDQAKEDQTAYLRSTASLVGELNHVRTRAMDAIQGTLPALRELKDDSWVSSSAKGHMRGTKMRDPRSASTIALINRLIAIASTMADAYLEAAAARDALGSVADAIATESAANLAGLQRHLAHPDDPADDETEAGPSA